MIDQLKHILEKHRHKHVPGKSPPVPDEEAYFALFATIVAAMPPAQQARIKAALDAMEQEK